MKRAFILVLDSFGIGELPDADKFGDTGSNTFLHIAAACAEGKADVDNLRKGVLKIPNMTRLGLVAATTECNNINTIPGIENPMKIEGACCYSQELSYGKDTPSGHWEIAGVPVRFDWHYFPDKPNCFPKKLIDNFIKEAKLPGVLGEKHASGTVIINELGDEHIKTGKPIVYTSADSVFQIAAHEEAFGLQKLYDICHVARKLVDEYNIGRVIARPFIGANGDYKRTGHRHDYSVPPPAPTLLDKLVNNNGKVIAIGKITDIYANCGISKTVIADGNMALFDATLKETLLAGDRSLVFTNFVDFDMLYGHRRDIAGYAHALESFDKRLPEFEKLLQPGDIAIITADHGCDPTFKGTDHTREYTPILIFGPDIKPQSLGLRKTFADIGQTLAEHFDLPNFPDGESFYYKLFN